MLFNSFEFMFVFLPIVLIGYYTFGNFGMFRVGLAFLAISSLAFYAYWDPRYLLLLLLSIAVNFIIGTGIEKTRSRVLLTVGVFCNFALLGYYKYTNFFIDTINSLLATNIVNPDILLPLGISFFTFTQTAYLVDAYRGETENYGILRYSLFVTIFPHLIAGPILYHKSVIPQFAKNEILKFNSNNFTLGIVIFVIGLFKKVVVADSIAPFVNTVFSNVAQVSFFEAWVGALGYTLQLYFDFSGYSDMAIGLGWMVNINLPINFNSPYKALSIIDFWRRWHITLSEFLRNYLYIPLGGNRYGSIRRYTNLFITMLLGGFWHGAGWTFIIWGCLHGFYLIINHAWRRLSISLPNTVSWFLTFFAIVVAWVFFRADNTHDAFVLLQTMFGLKGVYLPLSMEKSLAILKTVGVKFDKLNVLGSSTLGKLAILLILIRYVTVAKETHEISSGFKPNFVWLAAAVAGYLIVMSMMNNVSDFLYFRF